jgi:hypothetical protein
MDTDKKWSINQRVIELPTNQLPRTSYEGR